MLSLSQLTVLLSNLLLQNHLAHMDSLINSTFFFLKTKRSISSGLGAQGQRLALREGCVPLCLVCIILTCVLAVFLQISSLTKILNARKHISGEVFVRGNLFLRRTNAHMGLVDTKTAGPWGSGVLELGARKKKGQSERKGPDINPPFFSGL